MLTVLALMSCRRSRMSRETSKRNTVMVIVQLHRRLCQKPVERQNEDVITELMSKHRGTVFLSDFIELSSEFQARNISERCINLALGVLSLI